MKNGEKKPNMKAIVSVVVCAAIIMGLVAADFIKSRREYTDTDIAMNTVISLKLYGSHGKENAKAIKEKIKAADTSLLSRYAEGSDVNRINTAQGKTVFVSPEVAQIIEKSIEISKKCNGVFDITIGKITELWGFGGENPKVPSEKEIKALLPYVGAERLKISEDNSVKINENQAIDLGAVGKGAACDIIKTQLSSLSTDSAVISVGGSLLLYGNRSFKIGVVNPDDDKNSMGTLELSDTCVSTSGNYEQVFEADGKKYHHILDAGTGYPAESHLKSVTVVCDSGLVSDALSTACYILGYGQASFNLLKEYNAEAIFITRDNVVRYTDGLKNKFTVTDDNFTVGK